MNQLNNCVNNLFNNEDFKSKIKKKDIINHNSSENAWILLNNNVYSIKNDDIKLLNIFKDYYAKDVKEYLLNNFSNKERIIILDDLKKRKIGMLK